MALKFIDHEDVVFRRAPLISVLCQIRFNPVLSLLSDVGVSGFQEALRGQYPHFTGEQSTAIAVQPNEGRSQIGVQQSAPIWRLADAENSWHVSLGPDFVALETPRYLKFNDFLDRLMVVLAALDRTVHPGDAVRIGLRKINVLTHPEVDEPKGWQGFLRPELLSLAGIELPGPINFSLSTVRVQDGVNHLRVNYGIVPAPTFDQVPSRLVEAAEEGVSSEEQRQFVLDLDYSSPVPYAIRRDDAMTELLQEFSDGMTSFFHWSIEEPMYRWLEPVPRASVDVG